MHIRYVVSGQITRRDTRKGVHGLLVEVWAEGKPCDACLSSGLTNRDGSYRIEVRDEDLPDSVGSDPVLFVKVRDRECRVIHDTRSTMSRCVPGEERVIDLALVPDVLWWHFARPLTWEPPAGALVPADVLDEIREAVGLLAPPGTTGHAARVRAALCSLPPIEAFDHLLGDAWSTLEGDHDAAARLQDVLQALCAQDACECCDTPAAHAEIVDRIFEEAATHECHGCMPCPGPDDPCEHDRGECKCHRCKPDGEPPCPCRATFVTTDKALTLIMAALHVSCGHERTAKTYVLALLDQLCRFEQLGALHRSAGRALSGDPASRDHFRDLVEFAASRCRAGSGERAPVFPARDPQCCCSTCLDCELERCLHDAVAAWHCLRCYAICEIDPARACPGDEIVIRGCGFGALAGTVMFRQHGAVAPGPVVTPESWCDDEIRVIVPEGAGCGLVVQPPAETVRVCDRFVELRPHGCAEASFEGTSAEVLRFGVEGRTGGECLEPGEPLRIRWRTCAADRVRVAIVDEDTGAVIAVRDPAPATGRWDFTDTDFTSTRRVRVQLTARGSCRPSRVVRQISFVFQARPALAVIGTEVTQGIQYNRAAQHLTDPADRGPDNSLRLVTNKTAWVRAYLRSGQDPAFQGGQLPGVDGTLTVERRVGGVWSVVASIPSQNGPITAQESFATYDAERGNINASLNFVVPANVMTGLLRFTVNVASDLTQCPGNQATGGPVVCDVNLTQTLNAAFITIAYNGPNAAGTGNLNLPAPTLAQCQAETAWAMTTYPVSGAPNVRIAGTFTTATPLNDPRSCPGCCSPNWGPLLQTVANLVAADQAANPGATWVYYGIVAGGIPVNVPGCNGVATGGLAGQPITYAHEIGHQFGLAHARCGNAGTGNANYPIYEPYDLPVDPPGTTNWTMASIGEYGVDINNGAIANPNNAEDFMSYCGPPWISLFTHGFLINAPGLVPQTIPTGSGAATQRVIPDIRPGFARATDRIEPLVQLLGRVEDDAVEVSSVARIETRYLIDRGVQTDYVAQLVGEDGRIIAQDTLYRFAATGCGCGKADGCCGGDGGERGFAFRAMLDDHALGASLRIVRGEEVVWERARPSTPAELTKASAKLGDRDVKLTWRFRKGSRSVEDIWIRWSNDDGRTWRALTVGLTGTSTDIPLDQLPAGDVKFQILAHDGFSTASAATDTIQLPPRPPTVTTLYPKTDDVVYAERHLHLWGTATSAYDAPISDERFVWSIDGNEVGRGRDLWVDSPEPGHHELRLDVSDEGGTGSVASDMELLQPPPSDGPAAQ
jgi:hypothetical protein